MTIVVAVALAAVLVLAVVVRRYWETWLQIAGLLGAVLLMIWLQDAGYLNGASRPAFDRAPAQGAGGR